MTNVPEKMTAIEISQPGPPDVLRATSRPMPQPAPGEVLIRVEAAGVNRPDVTATAGTGTRLPRAPPTFPGSKSRA